MLITVDALLTQRELARYLVEDRRAHYHFTVKANQASLLEDIKTVFKTRGQADAEIIDAGHGRIEKRSIWVSQTLNEYADFPYVGQVFVIERESFNKKSGKLSKETAYGVTSQRDYEADAKKILEANRRHWCIENSCHYILDCL